MDLVEILSRWWFFAVTLALLVALHWAGSRFMLGTEAKSQESRFPRLLVMLALTVVGVVVLVLAIPTDGFFTVQTKNNLLTLLGLAITALLTLSSTTLAANGMAGLMLRAVGAMRPGDFVRVEDHFGRITERGLFHTEIQTEDRDLLTLPNLYLATKPVRVVRRSGTIVSCEVSLGYDLPRTRVQQLLIRAAETAELGEPFVWITDLKDNAVAYRVCGFLADVKTIVSARSKLRGAVLDTLHGAGVEIVSPGFVYQRRTDGTQSVIPRVETARAETPEPAVEHVVFDKAEEAETLDQLKAERVEIERAIREAAKSGKADDAPDDTGVLQARLRMLSDRIDRMVENQPDGSG
jgi:small conductance mechanosensitive channel